MMPKETSEKLSEMLIELKNKHLVLPSTAIHQSLKSDDEFELTAEDTESVREIVEKHGFEIIGKGYGYSQFDFGAISRNKLRIRRKQI